jgi:hypothetical protein
LFRYIRDYPLFLTLVFILAHGEFIIYVGTTTLFVKNLADKPNKYISIEELKNLKLTNVIKYWYINHMLL